MQSNKQYASMADYKNDSYQGKMFLFVLAKRNSSPSFTSSIGEKQYYPETQKVLLTDEIIHGKGRDRSRRIIRYASGVDTIFVDKQKEIDLDRRTGTVVFLKGRLFVDSDNKFLLDFLMKSNMNGANTDRLTNKAPKYFFQDMGKQFEDQMAADDLEYEAVKWVKEADWNDLFGYARILMGPTAADKDNSEIKFQMRKIARSNPKMFLEGLDNPSLKRKQVVLEAIDEGYLKVNAANNTLCWADNPSSPLVTAPIGADIVDHFIKGSFSEAGERVYDAIEKFVRSGKEAAEEVVINNVPIPEVKEKIAAPQIDSPHASVEVVEELMEECLKAEIIEKSGPWFKFEGFPSKNNRAKYVEEILGNRALYDLLRLANEEYKAKVLG